jgi:hypothetical protein
LEEEMAKARFLLVALLALSVVPLHLMGQENPKPDTKKPAIPLKLQVTFAENEGEKKLANLPYTFFLKASDVTPIPSPWTKVRVGSRVPVYTGKDGGMQYLDVGTNIDARGSSSADGRFDIYLNLERSWVEGDVLVPVEKSSGASGELNPAHFKEPIIRQFKTELNLTMHDGQTIQTTQAADPLSGRVLTITVTMNVAK